MYEAIKYTERRMNNERQFSNTLSVDNCSWICSAIFSFEILFESRGYFGIHRIKRGSIPFAKHFSRRQGEQ